MDISVLADNKSVKLVMLILLKLFETHFYLYKLITFPYKISDSDNYIQLTAEHDNLVLDSKLLEKLMYNRLIIFLNKHDIVPEVQNGFREQKSTTIAIQSFSDRIQEALDIMGCRQLVYFLI